MLLRSSRRFRRQASYSSDTDAQETVLLRLFLTWCTVCIRMPILIRR